jgi:glycosyltransferase involved in cell wall biosynthesis
MWREYQQGFEEVGIFTRLIDRDPLPGAARPADGAGIRFYGLPEWNARRAVVRIPKILRIARQAVAECDAVWLHSPSVEADMVYLWARRFNKPICLECRGDQVLSQAYWVKRGARPANLLSTYFNRQFQRHLKHAWGCIFVAEQLCGLYKDEFPRGTRAEVISDARIGDRYFKEPRAFTGSNGRTIRLVNVGRLETQKDQATLIKAFSMVESSGLVNCELHLVGDGPLRLELEQLAAALHIEEKVIFHGFIPWGVALFRLYDGMDLFVLSSINEGMPRALLEAMACGLPCISTAVSGASELLPSEALVPIGQADRLAGRLLETIQLPGAADRNAAQCWQRIQDFRSHQLQQKKKKYLLEFREYVLKQ